MWDLIVSVPDLCLSFYLGLEYLAQDDTNFSKAYIVNKICETEFDLLKRNLKNELDKINRPNGSRNITEVPSPSLGVALSQLDWKQEGLKTCQRKKGSVSHDSV